MGFMRRLTYFYQQMNSERYEKIRKDNTGAFVSKQW